MSSRSKAARPRNARTSQSSRSRSKLLREKTLKSSSAGQKSSAEKPNTAARQQLKQYEEALRLFQQQKLHRAKQCFEAVLKGPSKELADRAGMHLRVCEQRISRPPAPVIRTAEDHYAHGVAMMNLGRWDEAREHLDRARKASPKADHIVYAMAVLDCLTGEAEAAMQNLQLAIQLRPENRYHARNDEDFAFLQEDPRFTELLYPERDGSSG
jgi:tetratricopeptide (TPR) repeat protein